LSAQYYSVNEDREALSSEPALIPIREEARVILENLNSKRPDLLFVARHAKFLADLALSHVVAEGKA